MNASERSWFLSGQMDAAFLHEQRSKGNSVKSAHFAQNRNSKGQKPESAITSMYRQFARSSLDFPRQYGGPALQ